MHVLIINFRLDGHGRGGLPRRRRRAGAGLRRTPRPAGQDLARPADGVYGGVYLFGDRASMEGYPASELFATVAASPAFADISSRDFPVHEDLTRITPPGLPVAA